MAAAVATLGENVLIGCLTSLTSATFPLWISASFLTSNVSFIYLFYSFEADLALVCPYSSAASPYYVHCDARAIGSGQEIHRVDR